MVAKRRKPSLEVHSVNLGTKKTKRMHSDRSSATKAPRNKISKTSFKKEG
jgi:hypothetical protein